MSKVLGGPSLFVKRDDMTDLAFGGNKARKLGFIFAAITALITLQGFPSSATPKI